MSVDRQSQQPCPTRRELFRWTLGGGLGAAGLGAKATALGRIEVLSEDPPASNGPALIIRNARPLDAETPVDLFDEWRTPNDLFFVRSHFLEPAVELIPWRLEIGGLVKRSLALSLDDLDGLEQVTLPAVLQCAGNGRSFFRPRIPGIAWERGAVGNAEWTGVRLADLLERAGVQPNARHIHMLGADYPPNPKTPAFLRSIPLERALDPSTLVATHMNDEPLPVVHGGPLRLVVPTWFGNHWLKWLRSITLAEAEAPGFYQQTGYRIPRELAPPGSLLPDDDTLEFIPVTAMNVKALIAQPAEGTQLASGRVEVVGVAWTGPGRITRVDVSIDDGPWNPATLDAPDLEGSWRVWRFPWDARPGRHVLRARASDSQGQIQPNQTPWNRSGYLWNAIESVTCDVA